jgi:ABC-type phosphate transport system substrate-binding protein
VAPDSNGSIFGLNKLVSDGQAGRAAGEIAMSDGAAPPGGLYAKLVGEPVAIIVFQVAVNAGVGSYNLTTSQVQQLFSGAITNWSGVGGPNLPVRVVSREFGSGTRRAFDTYVLGGQEKSPSSFDCVNKNTTSSPVTLCNEANTVDVLQAVSSIAGAIGYAQTGDVAAWPGGHINPVALNGLSGSFGNLGRSTSTYPFWTVEYLYTYGKATGLASAFLNYLGTSNAVADLHAGGYTPCPDSGTSRARSLCAQAGA